MKTNKGIIRVGIAVSVIIILVVGGIVYYAKNNYSEPIDGVLTCNVNNMYDTTVPSCACPRGYTYKLSFISEDESNKKYSCVADNYPPPQQDFKTINKIISPNGGEKISAGSIYKIKWDPELFGNVDTVNLDLKDDSIDCSHKQIGCWSSFGIENTKNTGSYLWDTSKALFGDAGPGTVSVKPGSSYRISVSANGTFLKSHDTFSIIQ